MKTDPTAASVSLKESESFGNCQCDVTAGACDNFCCCDLDCSASLRKLWQQNENNVCLNNQKNRIMKLNECAANVTKKKLSDVQDGFKMFGKASSLLMCSAKVGGVGDTITFIDPIEAPSDMKGFNDMINGNNEKVKIDYYTKDYNSQVIDPAKNEF